MRFTEMSVQRGSATVSLEPVVGVGSTWTDNWEKIMACRSISDIEKIWR